MAIQRGAPVLGYHAANAYQAVPYPAGVAVDDLVVVAIGDRYLATLPAGWTSIYAGSGTNQSGRLAWRKLTAGDVAAGTFTYTLAGAGTGTYLVVAFEKGSYRTADPLAGWVTSLYASMLEAMPYLAITAGQTVYHYANGRTEAPGAVVGNRGTLVQRRDTDPDSESALYTELAVGETTLNIGWDATTASNGAFKASFTVNDPPGITTLPGLSGTAAVLVAIYDVVCTAPLDNDILLTTAPVLTVMADGTPEPFSIQFEVAAAANFTSSLWTTTLTGRFSGPSSVTVGTALPANKVSYWRARAGDGTSWGQWSATHTLQPMLERTNGQEYMHFNTGAELARSPHAGDYMHSNVGFEVILSKNAGDYLHLNVGFEQILKRIGGDYLHLNVTTGVPAPHLWFAWLDHGFVDDHVWIYGQGLGSVLTEFHAQMRMLDSNTAVETTMSVFDWSVNPAGPHAYDDQRKIYPGTDGAEPVVNIQVTVVEVTIPTGVVTTATVVDYFLARTDGGVSNKIPFTLYPLIPMPVTVAQGNTRSAAALRVSTGQVPAQQLEQLYATFAPQAITALGGMLERPPQALVTSRSTFQLTAGTQTSDLDDPVDTPMPLGARWRPLEASIVPRLDLGTGVSLWTPVSGSANAWRIVTGTEPYVDETYTVKSRQGAVDRPAMLFPGDAWAELEEELADSGGVPNFTFAMVAVLHPAKTKDADRLDAIANRLAYTTVVSTRLDTPQPAGTHSMALILYGSKLTAKFGENTNNFLSVDIPGDYISTRPVVILFSTGGTSRVGRLSLLADKLYTTKGVHLPMAPHSRLYLGRDDEEGRETTMEVLDVMVGTNLGKEKENALITDLDGAYGVSGA